MIRGTGLRTYRKESRWRMWEPTSVGEENEAFFVRVWKLLPSRCILKNLKGKAQRGQYLLAVDFGCYKWYQSQTLGDVLARRLNLEGGGWTLGSVPARTLGPEEGWIGGPHSIREGKECQWEHWALKGVGLWDPTSVGEENEACFIRVWKPLPSRRVLKSLKGKGQIGQYLLLVGLGCY